MVVYQFLVEFEDEHDNKYGFDPRMGFAAEHSASGIHVRLHHQRELVNLLTGLGHEIIFDNSKAVPTVAANPASAVAELTAMHLNEQL
jgi:hypothetical protein